MVCCIMFFRIRIDRHWIGWQVDTDEGRSQLPSKGSVDTSSAEVCQQKPSTTRCHLAAWLRRTPSSSNRSGSTDRDGEAPSNLSSMELSFCLPLFLHAHVRCGDELCDIPQDLWDMDWMQIWGQIGNMLYCNLIGSSWTCRST